MPPCALVVAQERMRSVYVPLREVSFIEWVLGTEGVGWTRWSQGGKSWGWRGRRGKGIEKKKRKKRERDQLEIGGDTVTEFNLVGMAASGMLLPPAG